MINATILFCSISAEKSPPSKLAGAQIDAHKRAGQIDPGAWGMRDVDISGQRLAIFEANHLGPPLLKIAATFLTAPAARLSRPGLGPCVATHARVP